ncbi:MAG: VCBS repeat-containing protein, partial [Bacteriovoracaceae bacterium]|nr:VCBS repeat-containing protein [Bacteriovoracaceae bacterium]
AGDYKLRIKDSLGGMTWVDIVANKGASSFTTGAVTTGGRKRIMSVGDYDNDGNLDFTVAHLVSGSWRVRGYKGDGNSGHTYDQEFGSGYISQLVDLQADGDLDIAYTDIVGNRLCYRLQNPDKTFATAVCQNIPAPFAGTLYPYNLKAIFLNEDDLPDFVFGGSNTDGVAYHVTSNADGTLNTIKVYNTPSGQVHMSHLGLSVGDMNNDGYEDAVFDGAIAGGTKQFVTYLNGGESNIMSHSLYSSASYSGGNGGLNPGVCIADLNNDGFKDFMTRNQSSPFYTYLNDATMTYTLNDSSFRTYMSGNPSSTWHHDCTDFDGDGHMDIIAPMANRYYMNGGNEQAFFYATGDGSGGLNNALFFESSYHHAWWQNGTMQFGDFNNDGVLDFIAASDDNGALYVQEGVE